MSVTNRHARSPATVPRRGDVWYAYLDPTVGHEQTGRRPVLIVSVDEFNAGPSELVFIVPITSRQRGILYDVPINPPEGGLTKPSEILCDGLRSVSIQRLRRRLGRIDGATLTAVEKRLRLLQGL